MTKKKSPAETSEDTASEQTADEETPQNYYVVLLPFVGNLTRGSVVSEKDLGRDADAMVEEKSIRVATEDESKLGWVEHPDGMPKEWVEDAKAKPTTTEDQSGGGGETTPEADSQTDGGTN